MTTHTHIGLGLGLGFYLDGEFTCDRGNVGHVCTKIGNGVSKLGNSERERHTGLGIRFSDGDVGGIHSFATFLDSGVVPGSDLVLKQVGVGLEDLVRRAVGPGEVVLIENGHLEVTVGLVAPGVEEP